MAMVQNLLYSFIYIYIYVGLANNFDLKSFLSHHESVNCLSGLVECVLGVWKVGAFSGTSSFLVYIVHN